MKSPLKKTTAKKWSSLSLSISLSLFHHPTNSHTLCQVKPAVEAVEQRRECGSRRARQIQYLFKWAGEEERTWETRHSFERWMGGVDYDAGMSRAALDERFDELDALHAAPQKPKKTQKTKKRKL